MPPISKTKKDKISEKILEYLFSVSPEARFTSEISSELARDEEFIKSLLQELKAKKVVFEVTKNSQGLDYTKRKRWRLSNEAYLAYSRIQKSSHLSSKFDNDSLPTSF